MKYLLLLLLSLLLYTTCEKDSSSFGKQIEGTWIMQSFRFNGEETIAQGDIFKMQYKNYDGEEGVTEWMYLLDNVGGTDTVEGIYLIDLEGDKMTIQWGEDRGGLFGDGSPEMTFLIEKNVDTLVLENTNPIGNQRYIKAIKQ